MTYGQGNVARRIKTLNKNLSVSLGVRHKAYEKWNNDENKRGHNKTQSLGRTTAAAPHITHINITVDCIKWEPEKVPDLYANVR